METKQIQARLQERRREERRRGEERRRLVQEDGEETGATLKAAEESDVRKTERWKKEMENRGKSAEQRNVTKAESGGV